MTPRKAGRAVQSPTFEDNLRRLEDIVEKLEQGSVPLDESIKMYEEGIALSRKCMEKLNEAEKKLEILRKNGSGAEWQEE
ncbi:MAG: exodeoxyribonuclease VII small subunit [Ignavibacteria bacterium]|nr:exodeoxyribonuclease VII small subunit [Ignavibacteria bacterium]